MTQPVIARAAGFGLGLSHFLDADAGAGLRLRARDMAKIGQLVLAGGRWNDRQIVSRGWIETSTAPKIEATGGLFYGYLWWLGRSLLNGREVHWVGAFGRGGKSFASSRSPISLSW
jgi:CubicO group peptidase (beta-lactamase class C family)